MKRIKTPTPWPEATQPTPEQFVRWYEACTAAERLEIMGRLLADSDTAAQCFIHNHKALADDVSRMRGTITELRRNAQVATHRCTDACTWSCHWP